MPEVKAVFILRPRSSSFLIYDGDVDGHPVFRVVRYMELKRRNQDISGTEPWVSIEVPLSAWPFLGPDETTVVSPH